MRRQCLRRRQEIAHCPGNDLRKNAQIRHLQAVIQRSILPATGRRQAARGLSETMRAGGHWRRLNSFLNSLARAWRLAASSAVPSKTFRRASSSSLYGGRLSSSFWFGASSALGALSKIFWGISFLPARSLTRAASA